MKSAPKRYRLTFLPKFSVSYVVGRPLAAFAILATFGPPIARSQLVVEVQSSGRYSEAVNAQAFKTMSIQVNPASDGAEAESTLNNAWRAEFPTIDSAKVSSLKWQKIAAGNADSLRFVLWPLECKAPIKTPYREFKLKTLGDVHEEHRGHALRAIARGEISAARDEYTQVTKLDEVMPEGRLSDGSSTADLKHSFLREMLKAAEEYRHKHNWRSLSLADKKKWWQIESDWRLNLALDNESYADPESLTRLMEALSLWWRFAIERDLRTGTDWREQNQKSDAPFIDKEHSDHFHDDLEQLLECLRNNSVRHVLTDRISAVLDEKTLSKEFRGKLEVTDQCFKKNLEDCKLGKIEDVIDTLYSLYSPKTAAH